MKKVKILYLIDKKAAAGAQNHLKELMCGLNTEAFEAKLITLRELSIKRIYGISGVRGLIKLIKYMKNNQFDIVQSYLFSENILGVIAAKIAGVKTIITGRRDTGLLMQGKWQHILAYRLTNRWIDKIVCVSEAVKKVAVAKERLSADKVEVIYNGVDVDKFRPQTTDHRLQTKAKLGIKSNELVVGMIANFSWVKGHQEFIEAANFVLKEIPNVKFLLIGDGPLKKSCQLSVSSSQLKDKVLFLGSRQDIPELLSIMDLSVNASYSEGMSNTILESMAAGLPVVATGVDGNLETVIDKETGILVPPKRPLSMANAIVNILKDKGLARRMGENARKLVSNKFNSKLMASNFTGLYIKLMKKRIAFVFSQFPCYDETFILREMRELMKEGLTFSIYSIKPCNDKIRHSEADELALETHYMPFFSLKLMAINLYFILRRPLRYLVTFGKLIFGNIKSINFFIKTLILWPQAVGFAWQARKDKITIVHGQWATFPANAAMIISRLNNIPFSFTGHAHDIYLDTTMLAQKIKSAKFVTTCTQDNKEYLSKIANGKKGSAITRRLLEDKIIVNYHGLDIGRFDRVDRDRVEKNGVLNILSVGSLLECKGFDVLIDACRILKDRGLNFSCTIAGGGPLESKLKAHVSRLKLEKEINFLGYITQDKLIPFYHKADIFALPVKLDIHWGIPNVLIEAMAAKIPIICTPLPSITEIIRDGATGFLVPENDPQVLAEKLFLLHGDKELREEVAIKGQQVVKEKFDIRRNVNSLIQIFNANLN